MSASELKTLLDEVPDTRELVIRRAQAWAPELDAWKDARDDARAAYRTWRLLRCSEAYSAYRAAQDREDAAQDALVVRR